MTWATGLLAPDQPWAPLLVATPLAAALAAVPFGRRAPLLLVALTPFSGALAVLAIAQVWSHGEIVYHVGGWPPPLGITLRIDGLSAVFIATTALVATGVALFSLPKYGRQSKGETRAAFAFWPLLFAMWAGLNAVFASNDLFNLYVALELLTLTAVALVALDGKPKTIAAAIRYLLFALTGSLAYLLGVIFLYGVFGSLDISALAISASPHAVVLAAGVVMTTGLLAKTALFPLHGWLPPAHSGAPAPASAMLSALVVKASFFIILRLWFTALPMAASAAFLQLLASLGAVAIVFGSVLALRQNKLKLIVAYSTVAQLGYLFLMFPLAGGGNEMQSWAASAWTGGVFQALAHATAKAAMFLAVGAMIEAAGEDRLDRLTGIAHGVPVAVFAFGLASLSLMGLPPSGGFIAKYLLLTSALASGQWWWAAVMIAGGLLAAAYLFRPLSRALAEADPKLFTPVPRLQQFIPLALAALSVLLGIFSAQPYALLQIGRVPGASEGLP